MDVVILDSKNATYRHGYTRALLANSAGKPTGAIFGILSCLIRLNKFYPDAKYIFCWDGTDTNKSWRNKIYPEYKGNRHKPGGEMPVEVKAILSQIPTIKKVLDILGFQQYEVPRLEADDLIGVVATELAARKDVKRVLIYSMDKDFFQLIGGKISVVRDLDKSMDCTAFSGAEVKKKYSVGPKGWIRFRALTGDSSDNIKSPFPKVGTVRALKLLASGLDPAHKKPTSELESQYKEHWSKAHLNYRLSKIVTGAESKVLTETDKMNLHKVLATIETDKGIRRKNKKWFNSKGYKEFIKICGELELNWILEQRHIFYRLGW